MDEATVYRRRLLCDEALPPEYWILRSSKRTSIGRTFVRTPHFWRGICARSRYLLVFGDSEHSLVILRRAKVSRQHQFTSCGVNQECVINESRTIRFYIDYITQVLRRDCHQEKLFRQVEHYMICPPRL